jgi:hypothetical protein
VKHKTEEFIKTLNMEAVSGGTCHTSGEHTVG